MTIIYISTLCSKKNYARLFSESKYKGDQQIQKYHKLMVKGFIANDIPVFAVTSPPINRDNCSKRFVQLRIENNNLLKYYYLLTINIGVVKNLVHFFGSFMITLILIILHKKCVVICDVLNISSGFGAILASRLMNKKSIGIVTDLPSMMARKPNAAIVKINNFFINQFSSYIFLTEQMNEVLNKKSKPYLIIEGQVDMQMKDTSNLLENKSKIRICHYAGGLQVKYGIELLVKAFLLAEINNCELHLYGSGDYESELIKICQQYKNIKYFGIIDNDLVVKEQIKSTLLINPRPTNESFTKYSFPSKNMEFMVSGTPMLTTKLPGMPRVYNEYIYLIEEETIDGLAKTLKEILGKSNEELHEKGRMAKEFVLRNKSNKIQAARVVKFVNSL